MKNIEGKEEVRQKANWNIRPYLAVGLTAFIVIIASIAVFFLIFRYHGLAAIWDKLMGILQPIIIGLVFAYLINPIVKFEERYLLPRLKKWMKKEEKAQRVARGISVFGAIAVVFIIVYVLLKMVIPELYASIERMITNLPRQAEAFMVWVENHISADSAISKHLEQGLEQGVGIFDNWARTEFLPQTKSMLTSVTSGVISFVKVLFNIAIGVIISVYVLMGKETFVGQAKKITYAVLPVKKGNALIEILRKANEIFGGFISGKILDSAIIGLLCFIGLYLLKMPYTVLVSVIVGVTNVIPFFGPYIGAVPSAILITLTSPIQGLYFIIFIFVLQQLDGNVIGPSILGESTGLSSFWVIFAILVGGGLFGFIGMVMGVPVFATFYYIAQRVVSHVLGKKGLPLESAQYTELDRVNPDTNNPTYLKKEEPKGKEDKEEKKR